MTLDKTTEKTINAIFGKESDSIQKEIDDIVRTRKVREIKRQVKKLFK